MEPAIGRRQRLPRVDLTRQKRGLSLCCALALSALANMINLPSCCNLQVNDYYSNLWLMRVVLCHLLCALALSKTFDALLWEQQRYYGPKMNVVIISARPGINMVVDSVELASRRPLCICLSILEMVCETCKLAHHHHRRRRRLSLSVRFHLSLKVGDRSASSASDVPPAKQ